MSSYIGQRIPKKIKAPIVNCINRASNIVWILYNACRTGKLYCPDALFQKWDFYMMTGRKLNLRNPVTFQDKLQWLKLHNRNPLYTTLVDKYAVRKWVADKIGEKYLVPLYGVYNSFDEIDFDKLPNEFVLKCTHDSGSVVICKDKSSFDIDAAREKLNKGLAREQFYLSREWPYKNVPHRIICEALLKNKNGEDLRDYKLFCFNEVVKIICVISDRESETGEKINYYDSLWSPLPMKHDSFPNNDEGDPRPRNLNDMLCIAKKISLGMPFVRVDFYNCNDMIYFGEITFFPSGGYRLFVPDKYNYILGEWLELPSETR